MFYKRFDSDGASAELSEYRNGLVLRTWWVKVSPGEDVNIGNPLHWGPEIFLETESDLADGLNSFEKQTRVDVGDDDRDEFLAIWRQWKDQLDERREREAGDRAPGVPDANRGRPPV